MAQDVVRRAYQLLAQPAGAKGRGVLDGAPFDGDSLNPQLDDRSPARLLREGELDDVGPAVTAAARAFLVGG